MPEPVMTRFEPTINATGVIVVTWAVGIPALSISTAIAAPQRVLVPQVEVKITPSTPSVLSCSAMLRPILLAFSRVVAAPVVEKIVSQSFLIIPSFSLTGAASHVSLTCV